METISIFAQLVVSISVVIVWVFRYDNTVVEFKHYGLSSLVRNVVGASKIALATVLILGIWYQEFLILASLMKLLVTFILVQDDNLPNLEAWLRSQPVVIERFGEEVHFSLKKRIAVHFTSKGKSCCAYRIKLSSRNGS